MERPACGWPEIREAGQKKRKVNWCRSQRRRGTEFPESGGGGTGPQSQRDKEQDPRVRGSKGPPTPDQEEGAGTPEVGRKTGLDPQIREEKAELSGSGGGGHWIPGSPRERGQDRLPFGASRGGARKDPGGPCCATPGISVPSPRGSLIPRPQITISPQVTETPSPPAQPWLWLCSRDPSVSRPVSALTALALFSTAFFPSAEAAASPFRSHGVSNRSPLPLQPPFPPFRSSRPSRPVWGGEKARVGNHGRAGAEEERRDIGTWSSMRIRPDGGRGAFSQRMLALKNDLRAGAPAH